MTASVSPPPHGPGEPVKTSLWRNGDYVGWWIGNTLSAVGTSVSAIAFPLLVLAATGSVSKAGLIGSANLVGVLATALWGGALADRVSRRAILVVGPLAQGAVLAGVTLVADLPHPSMPLLVAASLLSGLLSGMVLGASTPALTRIVTSEQLVTANSQAMSRDMLAQLLGAPLGGLLFSLARWVPFGADALSFVFAALGALNIRRPLGPDRSQEAPRTSLLTDVGAGLRFVRAQPFLRFVVVMASLMNMVAQAFLLLLIALVAHRGGGSTTVGLVSSTMVAGGFVGSPRRAGRGRAGEGAGAAVRGDLGLHGRSGRHRTGAAGVGDRCGGLPDPGGDRAGERGADDLRDASRAERAAGTRPPSVNRFGAYALEWCGPLRAALFVVFLRGFLPVRAAADGDDALSGPLWAPPPCADPGHSGGRGRRAERDTRRRPAARPDRRGGGLRPRHRGVVVRPLSRRSDSAV